MFKILTLQEYLDICLNAKRVVGKPSRCLCCARCLPSVAASCQQLP
jgi:hypothetical protein